MQVDDDEPEEVINGIDCEDREIEVKDAKIEMELEEEPTSGKFKLNKILGKIMIDIQCSTPEDLRIKKGHKVQKAIARLLY